jgi:hypothetical protein
MDQPTWKPLTCGFITSSMTRSGSTVRRTAGPWSPAVHAWLAHLAQAGPGVAPRPVRLLEAARVEEVTYIAAHCPASCRLLVITGDTTTPVSAGLDAPHSSLFTGLVQAALEEILRQFQPV